MAFMLENHLVFIDSLQFMSSTLDKLVSNLPNDAFKYTSEKIKNAKKLKLMKQKGVLTWIHLIGSSKINYQIKMIFITYKTMNIYLIRNMCMQFTYGLRLS